MHNNLTLAKAFAWDYWLTSGTYLDVREGYGDNSSRRVFDHIFTLMRDGKIYAYAYEGRIWLAIEFEVRRKAYERLLFNQERDLIQT